MNTIESTLEALYDVGVMVGETGNPERKEALAEVKKRTLENANKYVDSLIKIRAREIGQVGVC